jgi:hypothetical protein
MRDNFLVFWCYAIDCEDRGTFQQQNNNQYSEKNHQAKA